MEPQGGRRNDVQTVGLNAETKKVSAPSRRGDISLDIRFYRTLTGTALPGLDHVWDRFHLLAELIADLVSASACSSNFSSESLHTLLSVVPFWPDVRTSVTKNTTANAPSLA